MIYCIRFEDVVAHLQLGFRPAAATSESRIFRRLSIRGPNVDGDVPEILVNDAFDAAGLQPPAWDVFWCDWRAGVLSGCDS